MVAYNPFAEMSRLFDEMDRRFAGMRASAWRPVETDGSAAAPALDGDVGTGRWPFGSMRRFGSDPVRLDVDREAGEYVAIADLPGFETDEIDLAIEENVLVVDAVHEVDSEEYARSRQFHERVVIPAAVDAEAAAATYRNGVLEVRLPTADRETGHRIEIEG